MAIYRGSGGSGDSTQDSYLNEVTQQAINASNSASDAATSATNAASSASGAAADLVLTNADVVLAEADKVQTGLDKVATAADKVLTNADVVLTHADVVLTNADVAATANKLPLAGGAMTGAITTNSTFDGRDVATDGTKLDGVAANANNYSHPANHAISVITGLQTALDAKAATSHNHNTLYDPIGASVAMAIALGG